jgi:hypothetical protein
MRARTFSYLAANRHHGIQRRHRLLEDHGDLTPPQPLKRTLGLSQQINRVHVAGWAAAPQDLPRNPRRRSEQSHNRQRGHALARPRLAHQPQHFAFLKAQVHAAHRLSRRKANLQIVNLKQWSHEAILVHLKRARGAETLREIVQATGQSGQILPIFCATICIVPWG